MRRLIRVQSKPFLTEWNHVFFTGTTRDFTRLYNTSIAKDTKTAPPTYLCRGPAMAGIGSSSRKNSKEEISIKWTSL